MSKLQLVMASVVGVAVVVWGTVMTSKPVTPPSVESHAECPDQLNSAAPTPFPVVVTERDGEPREGADIEVGCIAPWHDVEDVLTGESGALVEVARATTGDDGRAQLELPSADELRRRLETENSPDSALRSATIVVEVSSGGERTVHHAEAQLGGIDLAIQSDRRLYQPGQTIRMRAVAVEPLSGRPVSDRREVVFEVRDPRDNELFRRRAKLGPTGVAAASFSLAEEARNGEYRLVVRDDSDGVVEERIVDVRPYEKPRIEVDFGTTTDQAVAGDSVAGELAAEWMYGDAVAGAEVEVQLALPGASEKKRPKWTGKTDDSGEATWELELPEEFPDQWRDRVELTAVVTPADGQSRRVETTIPTASAADVEVLPAEWPQFVAEAPNEGVVVVRDRSGAPVPGAEVELGLPGEVSSGSVETDSGGRAKIEWTPVKGDDDLRSARSRHPHGRAGGRRRGRLGRGEDVGHGVDTVEGSATVRYPDGAKAEHEVELAVADPDSIRIRPGSAVVTAGETVDFDMKVPSSSESGGATMEIVALRRGTTVARTTVDVTDSRGEGSLELGQAARGLTRLVALDERMRPAGSAPIWVRQAGTDRVDVQPVDSAYRPGETARVDLSFPATSDATEESTDKPVTYGLWGIDEALHTLQRKADVPIEVLLREEAGTVEAAASAIAGLESESDPELALARLAREASDWSASGGARVESSYEIFAEEASRPLVAAWAVFLILGMLVLVVIGAREVLRVADWEVFSWRALVALLAVPVVVVAFQWWASQLSNHELDDVVVLTMLAVAIWSATSFLGVVVSAILRPAFARWCGVTAACHGLAVALAVSVNAGVSLTGGWSEVVSWGVAVVFAALAAQAFVWVMILNDEDGWWGAASIGTFAWLAVGIALLLVSCSKAGEELRQKAGSVFQQSKEAKVGARLGQPAPSSGQGDAGDDSGGREAASLEVRDFFPDTAVWRPAVRSDAEGDARVEFELPDTITSWRLKATAHTSDGRFGRGEALLEARKPFFVDFDPPGHLTAGDELTLPVSLVDGRAEVGEAFVAELEVEAKGALELDGSVQRRVEIPGGERRSVDVAVRARRPGSGSLEIRARLQGASDDSEGDAVNRSLEVHPEGRTLTRTRSSVVGEGWETELTLPEGAYLPSSSARVELVTGQVTQAIEGLEAMLSRPSGCFEQTSSSTFPNVMILRSLEKSGPDQWEGGAEEYRDMQNRAEKLVQTGYQRLLLFQTGEGGFTLWPTDRIGQKESPEVMLTAYGMLQIEQMSPYLSASVRNVTRSAAAWLKSRQNGDGTWPYDRSHAYSQPKHPEIRSTSYAIWGLSEISKRDEHQSSIEKGVNALTDRIADVDNSYELALAANALAAADRDGRAGELVGRIAANVERGDETAHWTTSEPAWMGGTGKYAAVETTALVVRALDELGVKRALAESAGKYLASSRQPEGDWGTTQATAWALDAVTRMRASLDEPLDVEVHADGEPMRRENGAEPGKARLYPDGGAAPTFSKAPLNEGNTRFTVEPERSTRVTAQLTARYSVDWDSPAAQVEEEPFDLEVAVEPRRLRPRQPATVDVTLEAPEAGGAGATIVELPVPPGGWADDSQLERMVEEGPAERIERRPRHLIVYLSEVDSGATLDFTYRVVPELRGTYSLPKLKVWRYYNPQPAVARDGGEIEVVP